MIQSLKYPLIAGLAFLFQLACGQIPPGLLYGGSDNEAGTAICVTPDNGYLLAGSTRSEGAGSWDAYAVRLSEYGAPEWIMTYGWLHHDHIQSVTALPDGFLFCGHIWDYGLNRLDIYLLKTDLMGNKVFDRLYGTDLRDMGFDALPSANGGYLILGYTRGYEPHGDIFMIHTDGEGNELWRNHYGTDNDEYAYSFYEKSDGSVIIFGSTGSFHDDVHFSYKAPSADWFILEIDQQGYETNRIQFPSDGHSFAREILPHDDGGYYLFGSSQAYGAGSFDMLLMHIDEEGNEVWQKSFGGADYEYGMSMDRNLAGDLYLFGTTKSFGEAGSPDYYLVKVDDQGQEAWSLTAGGDDLDYGTDVVSTSDDGCALLGHSRSFGSGGFDMLMIKVTSDGIVEYLIGGVDSSALGQMAVYPNPVGRIGRVVPGEVNISYRMDLVTLNGTEVRSFLLRPPDYQFNVESLPAGIYVYRIAKASGESSFLTGKLMVR